MKIAGSVALVTGANRGLGRAYARELAGRGAAKVFGAARHPDQVTAHRDRGRRPAAWPGIAVTVLWAEKRTSRG